MYKYIINIKTGAIHNAINPCSACKRMIEANKKMFNSYDDAENYFEGDKKGTPCGVCLGGQRPTENKRNKKG